MEAQTHAVIIELIDAEVARLDARRAELTGIREGLSEQPRRGRPPGSRNGTGKRGPNQWRVSPEKREAVLQAVRESMGPVTRREIHERTGISNSTVDYALRELREREEIRQAGRGSGNGRPKLYAEMPS